MTMAILATVVPAVFQVAYGVERAGAFAKARSDALDEIGTAMDRMTKEIRQATTIRSATGTSLDVDTYVNGVATRVAYSLSGSEIVARVDDDYDVVLLERVAAGDVFTYTPDSTAPSVIKVTLRVEPERLPETTVELASEVKLRNMGLA